MLLSEQIGGSDGYIVAPLFHSAHQGAVSVDNVESGAKQLRAWAVTIRPDREGSYSGSMQAGTNSAMLTRVGIQYMRTHARTFAIACIAQKVQV